MCLTVGQQHKLNRHPYVSYLHDNATFTPPMKNVRYRHMYIKPDTTIQFQGFGFDDGPPHSVTEANQWSAYLSIYHIPTVYHDIHQLHSNITFGGSQQLKVEVFEIGCVTIQGPLPGQTYFDYHSLHIHNHIPILSGLAT